MAAPTARHRFTPGLRLWLLAAVLLGFALRVARLDAQSLWYDEGVTAMLAQRGLGEITRWTANDIQPPLYYYVVWAWGQVAGWSEWALRWPSAWCGVLAVPLLAVLARRLLTPGPAAKGDAAAGRTAGVAAVLAAVLAAVHPLLVYYGQEARMYALLVLLSVLAGYLLVRTADAEPPAWALWAGYVLAATAAVYTHYFAFFLIGGLALAWLLDRGRRQRWPSLVLANVGVLALYAPWFAVLFNRLRVDRSYWEGPLKLNEALLDVGVSFTSGETMPERLAAWLLLGYVAVTLLAAWGLWRGARRASAEQRTGARRVTLYGLLWLTVPLSAVLVLALNVPKFNPRYVMVALPGLLLLWAAGLALLFDRSADAQPLPTRRFGWPQLAGGVGLAALLLGFAWADANWFANPRFTKDQWRELTTFLRTRVAADEQIVLVSGHAWPVWEYYAPDLPVVRLPDLPTLDVDAVLDFANTGPALQSAFADATGKRGAWLVTWQDEVVDPNDVTPVQLELSGREKGQTATFFGLGLRRYGGLRPQRFATAPPVAHELDVTFGDQLVLRGYTVLNNGDLLLFWQRGPGLAGRTDLHLALATLTAAGEPLARPEDRRVAGYNYPTFRWPQGEVVLGHIPAAAWLGPQPQPGTVQLTLRVYDAANPAAPLPTPGGATDVTLPAVEVVID